MSNKVLITSGCSFTWNKWDRNKIKQASWSDFLAEDYSYTFNEAKNGQSNRLIKNRIYHRVNSCLKQGFKPEDINVGIMWSGIDRTAFYYHISDDIKHSVYRTYIENELNFNFDSNQPNQFFWMQGQKLTSSSTFTDNYYKRIYIESDHIARFFEDIIATQNFLKSKNIKYFMTTAWELGKFKDDVWRYGYNNSTITNLFSNEYLKKLGIEYNLTYFTDMIDFTKFIKIKGLWEYCHFVNPGRNCKLDHHPTSKESERFSNDIIKPFIQKL